MSIGLPATGALTPFWGWVLTVVGGIACLSAIPLSIRGIKLFKAESGEIELRKPFIMTLRKVLPDLELQIDNTRSTIEEVPLSYYEETYLSKFDDYENFKKKYSTENDARYVALGVHYGLNENPLFSDSLKNNRCAQSLLTEISSLKTKLPDSILHNLIDDFIRIKYIQSVNILSHKLNPARWDAYVSDIKQRDTVESKVMETLRMIKRQINKRLNKLLNGAKYE